MNEPWWPLEWTELVPNGAAKAIVRGHPIVTEALRSFDGSVSIYGNLPMTKGDPRRWVTESVLDLRCLLLSLAEPNASRGSSSRSRRSGSTGRSSRRNARA